MCNVSQGIKEQGIEQGIKQGIEQGIAQGIKQGMEQGRKEMVLTMLKKKYPVSMIMDCTGYPIEKIQSIADEHHISVVYEA